MTSSRTDSSEPVNQLVLVVVSDEQAGTLSKKMIAENYRFTLITASNGLLPAGTTCLMLGINSSRNQALMDLVEAVCKTRRTYIPALGQFGVVEGALPSMIEAEVGSASVYVLPVEYYEFF
jgi:uncharacterized protein YaaQ